jgi:hypothetical protein
MAEYNGGTERRIALGVNVKDAKELPQVGRYLSRFIKEIDGDHGPFNLTVELIVAPMGTSALPPAEIPKDDDKPNVEITYIGFDDELEGA